MVPDDLDLSHRALCSQAVVTTQEEFRRLPGKQHGKERSKDLEHNNSLFGEFWRRAAQQQSRQATREAFFLHSGKNLGEYLRFCERLSDQEHKVSLHSITLLVFCFI